MRGKTTLGMTKIRPNWVRRHNAWQRFGIDADKLSDGEITDLLFTEGELGLMPIAIPFMLIVGFLTPWPYNYWRLKKYGQACH